MAADSPINLCHLALLRLGVDSLPESLDDPGKSAQACRLHYEQVRDELLQAHPWPWSDRLAPLALSSESVEGWQFLYATPDDCLRPRAIVDETGGRMLLRERWDRRNELLLQIERHDWRAMALDSGAPAIATDLENARLWYTRRTEIPAHWSALFRRALIAELAVRLQPALRADRRERPMLIDESRMAMSDAAADAGNWNTDMHLDGEPSSIRARW